MSSAPCAARLRRDGRQRDREVVAAAAGREDDGGGRGHRGAALGYGRRVILLLHNRYRVLGGEERAVDDLAWLIREHLGEDVEVLRARLGRASARGRGARAAARRPAARGGGRRGAPHRRARRARPQRPPDVRLARAGRGARGGRARRAAPAQLPARLRRSGSASRAARTARAATGATRCPGVRLNCRGGSRAEAAVYARGARALAAAARGERGRLRRPERVRAVAPARARRAGRRSRVGAAVGAAGVRGASSAARRRATCSTRAGSPRRRACWTRSPPAGAPDCRWWSPGDGPALERVPRARRDAPRAAGAGGRWPQLRAGAAVAIVPVALRGDPAARRAGGDGRRAAAWSRRAAAVSRRRCPRRASCPPGDVDALAARLRRAVAATPPRASARWPRVRELSAPGAGRRRAAGRLRRRRGLTDAPTRACARARSAQVPTPRRPAELRAPRGDGSRQERNDLARARAARGGLGRGRARSASCVDRGLLARPDVVRAERGAVAGAAAARPRRRRRTRSRASARRRRRSRGLAAVERQAAEDRDHAALAERVLARAVDVGEAQARRPSGPCSSPKRRSSPRRRASPCP